MLDIMRAIFLLCYQVDDEQVLSATVKSETVTIFLIGAISIRATKVSPGSYFKKALVMIILCGKNVLDYFRPHQRFMFSI